MPLGLTATCYIVHQICWQARLSLAGAPLQTYLHRRFPGGVVWAKSFEKTPHRKPLTRIILMIQIRGNRLLTVIKADVITRDVKAVTKLWETLISPPSVCSKVKQGEYLNYVTLRHNAPPVAGKINKRHHRQINKHIKQDWGDRNSGKSAAQSGSFAGLEITTKSIHQPFFHNKNI